MTTTTANPTIFIIPCGAAKTAHSAPARDLYTGAHFRHALRTVEAEAAATEGDTLILILSALHGLITLDTVISPYDVTIGDDQAITSARLARQLAAVLRTGPTEVYAFLPAAYLRHLNRAAETTDTDDAAGWARVHNVYEAAPGIGYQRAALSNLAALTEWANTNALPIPALTTEDRYGAEFIMSTAEDFMLCADAADPDRVIVTSDKTGTWWFFTPAPGQCVSYHDPALTSRILTTSRILPPFVFSSTSMADWFTTNHLPNPQRFTIEFGLTDAVMSTLEDFTLCAEAADTDTITVRADRFGTTWYFFPASGQCVSYYDPAATARTLTFDTLGLDDLREANAAEQRAQGA